jgi:transposase
MQHHLVAVLPKENVLLQQLATCQEKLDVAAATFRSTARQQVNPSLSKLLQSVPGVGPQTAALLIAELGDITRFKDAKAVIAYMGLDPRVKQSGTSLKRNTHLTKRGSPYLRRAMYLAAAAAQRHDQEMKATYDKKRAEGKRYREATIVVARRLVTRIYAVWKRGTVYQSRIA